MTRFYDQGKPGSPVNPLWKDSTTRHRPQRVWDHQYPRSAPTHPRCPGSVPRSGHDTDCKEDRDKGFKGYPRTLLTGKVPHKNTLPPSRDNLTPRVLLSPDQNRQYWWTGVTPCREDGVSGGLVNGAPCVGRRSAYVSSLTRHGRQSRRGTATDPGHSHGRGHSDVYTYTHKSTTSSTNPKVRRRSPILTNVDTHTPPTPSLIVRPSPDFRYVHPGAEV